MSTTPTLVHRVVERPLPVDRATAWAAVTAIVPDTETPLELGGRSLAERPLGVEPPWRWAGEVGGDLPVARCQTFVHLVPDPGGCLLVWSTTSELATGVVEADAEIEGFVDAMGRLVADRVDQVVDQVVGEVTPGTPRT